MTRYDPRATEAALKAQAPLPGTGRRDLRQQAANLRERVEPPKSTTAPPEEKGIRLATIPRGTDELHLTWDTYEGKPYLSLRLWTRGRDGAGMWPDRTKGISIRLRELPGLCDGLAKAMDMAADHMAGRGDG